MGECYQDLSYSTQLAHDVQMKSKSRAIIRFAVIAHPVEHSLYKGVARKRHVEIEGHLSERKLDGEKQLGGIGKLEAVFDLVSESYTMTHIAETQRF